jgi:hypothetical protein
VFLLLSSEAFLATVYGVPFTMTAEGREETEWISAM